MTQINPINLYIVFLEYFRHENNNKMPQRLLHSVMTLDLKWSRTSFSKSIRDVFFFCYEIEFFLNVTHLVTLDEGVGANDSEY